ncbi:hypothetical protein NPIL_318731 [Nephila pilipes]|uniref:Uncharacterized protein n=1 Tax=Nephila pilipes TaxID=299642 RepID=A0A8X6TIH3_NEPPI|nr:hypothetical protein NPIL_318731 [Nephila pilipes]
MGDILRRDLLQSKPRVVRQTIPTRFTFGITHVCRLEHSVPLSLLRQLELLPSISRDVTQSQIEPSQFVEPEISLSAAVYGEDTHHVYNEKHIHSGFTKEDNECALCRKEMKVDLSRKKYGVKNNLFSLQLNEK